MKPALIDLDEIDEILSNMTDKFGKCNAKERAMFRVAYKVTRDIKVQRCSQPALIELLTKAWDRCGENNVCLREHRVTFTEFLTQNNLTDETRTD